MVLLAGAAHRSSHRQFILLEDRWTSVTLKNPARRRQIAHHRVHLVRSRAGHARCRLPDASKTNGAFDAMGMMPPGMLQGAQAEEVAAYVAGGMKGEQPASFAACSSCHGMDGQGNGGMSPSLVTYDATLMANTLQHGKKGIIGKMPSFKTLITPVQEKALTVYIQSLSN